MKKISLLLLFGFLILSQGYAYTPTDSLLFAKTNWNVQEIKKGLIYKQASYPNLFGIEQNVNILEIQQKKNNNTIGLIVNEPSCTVSTAAIRNEAQGAINGSYFNVKTGKTVCYLKKENIVVDTTTRFELNYRVTGAVRFKKGKVDLIPWNKTIEMKNKKQKGDFLASGPLLIQEGKRCDFSRCDSAFIFKKHPRSAIGITKQGRILFVTVDGRFPNHAGGMSIPELCSYMQLLGCDEALNLDGGGSTTLWANLQDGAQVLNMPSDNKKFNHEGERTVANIIYVK